MKNPRANPVAEFFYNLIKEYSNINHTCPYDVSAKKLSTKINKNAVIKTSSKMKLLSFKNINF